MEPFLGSRKLNRLPEVIDMGAHKLGISQTHINAIQHMIDGDADDQDHERAEEVILCMQAQVGVKGRNHV